MILETIQWVLVGGTAVAVLDIIKEVVKWILHKRDRKEEKSCAQCKEEMKGMMAAEVKDLKHAQMVYMRDRIKYLCKRHLIDGEMDYEDRADILEMHKAYKALGGNGHLDTIVEELKALKSKQQGE